MSNFVRVLVDQSSDHAFDYAIPDRLKGRLFVGSRVRVPVRLRAALGTVIELLDASEFEQVKEVDDVIGDRPFLNPALIELARWMAVYYCCKVEAALRGILPEVIRKGEVGHKRQLMASMAREVNEEELDAMERRAPKQAAVLRALMGLDGPMTVSALARDCGVTHATIDALREKGLLVVDARTVLRDPGDNETFLHHAPLNLNSEQMAIFETIRASLDGEGTPKPILIHGVTGSGKTELYLQAIQHVLEQGKSAIMLVPEIALTPQTVERFKSRFLHAPTEVAVLHSHLSAGQRHDEWHKINEGCARIVIGARSAVFAPVQRLGVIIVDEEHEPSYKQEDAPRYHARDIAVMRGHFERCAVLLGSATPSIESYHNAHTGKYQLTQLTRRVDAQKMPFIRILDMRQETMRQKGRALLADKLVTAIRARLEKREQSILFLNRRGFSTSLLCQKCGYVMECPHCSIAMTFHRSQARLICHTCSHQTTVPRVCPECQDPGIRHSGAGTEKVEETVAKIFPDAVIRRMDADTMTRRDAYRETLGAFRAGKIDILVGTQMIAKGLHFPNVTLVGIVNADMALHLPDFRAGERTFQLLTQVAGRAGRGEVEGEVFVQSHTPFHPAIQFARHHDFDGFWQQEIEFRRAWDYPPFTHMVLISVRCPHQERASLTATTIARRLRENLPAGTTMADPAPAPMERVRGSWRFHLTLRGKAIMQLSRHIRTVLDKLPVPEDVIVTVDIDPYQLL